MLISEDLFTTCDTITFNQAQHELELCTAIQTAKFDRLMQEQRAEDRSVEVNNDVVMNLSTQELNENDISVLAKGLNFAITPKRIPTEDIIGNIEECMSRENIPKSEADEIRQDVAVLLRRAKLPASNLTKDEFSSLRLLKANKNIIILPADKGNVTVVLDTQQYATKIGALLADTSTYKQVAHDPTQSIMRKVNIMINKHKTILPTHKLRPSCPLPPKLYGLPKIHKEGFPLRPVVSQISSPTYNLAKFVAEVLKPLVGQTSSYVKDSSHFVDIINTLTVEEDEVLVSFDVESLFTNVPVQECLRVIKDLLARNNMREEYFELAELCLKSGYLVWNGDFYLQIDGVAMGSPISPVTANIWMEYFEKLALVSAPVKPKIWLRYVDDTFSILRRNEIDVFLQHLNTVHPSTKFTMELENNGSLPFLDVKVIRKADKTLGHTVYRKPTHTDRYLQATSHHHPTHLRSVASSLINRAHRICDNEHLRAELKRVDDVLARNGYNKKQRTTHKRRAQQPVQELVKRAFLPYVKGVTDRVGKVLKRHNIKAIFRPPPKIRQYLRSAKEKTPLQTPGVYAVPCSCGKSYIGQTKRSIRVRLQEHINAVRDHDPNRSAICEHLNDESDVHWIRFDEAKVLSTERFLIPRLVREAIEIKRRPNFNRENSFMLAQAWTPVLNNINNERQRVKIKNNPDVVSVICRDTQRPTENNGRTNRYNLRSRRRAELASSVSQ